MNTFANVIESASSAESELRHVIDSLPVLVSIVTRAERYGLVNKAYEDWFGVSREALVGRSVRDFIGEAAYEKLGPFVKRGLAGERFSFEQNGVPYRYGGTRDVKVEFVPRFDQDGAPDGYVALLADVTGQRALEREREQLAAQRAEVLRRQAEFEQQLIGIVSHDLRNPLNLIKLTATVLATREQLTEGATKNVLRIQNATDRAVRMVNDLLDFTQARLGGGIRLQKQRSDLRTAITTAVEEIEVTFPSRQIDTRLEGDLMGDWDLDRLAQVVQNLVTNALKYSPADTPVEVVVRGDSERRSVELRVHNQGAPIPAEQLESIFEPYNRGAALADRTSRSVGLGLSIVSAVVEGHGGNVQVSSTAAEGTTFVVTLPRVRDT